MSEAGEAGTMRAWQRLCRATLFAPVITLLGGYLLCLGGYMNIWPLFGRQISSYARSY